MAPFFMNLVRGVVFTLVHSQVDRDEAHVSASTFVLKMCLPNCWRFNLIRFIGLIAMGEFVFDTVQSVEQSHLELCE